MYHATIPALLQKSAMKLVIRIVVSGILVVAACTARGQQGTTYDIQANIIYRLTKYINWPEGSGEFVIGVVGTPPQLETMTTFLAGKTVGARNIVLRKFSPSSSSFPCQILFIPEEEDHGLRRIVTATEGMATLLVTESPGMAHKGACINFIMVDDHIKLEMNKNNIEQRKMQVAGELVNLCIQVK